MKRKRLGELLQERGKISAKSFQRLVRKLCSCRTKEAPTEEYIKRFLSFGWTPVPDRVQRPVGCSLCDQTGYKDRVGIYELLVVDQSIRTALRSGFKPEIIRGTAMASGMERMQDDAFEKLHLDVTTLEEILRAVPIEDVTPAECARCRHELQPAFHYCPFCGLQQGPAVQALKSNLVQLVSGGGLP